jgi:hypothetical protein
MVHARLNISPVCVNSLVDAINNGTFDRSTPGFIPFQQDDWHGWCVNGSALSHFEQDAPVYCVEQVSNQDRMFFPEVEGIVEALPSEVCAIRLLRLAPGGFIDFHIDDYEKFGKHDWRVMRKVHVPIITNEFCRNFDRNSSGTFSSYWMQAGQYWFLDGSKLHGACNYGQSDRWHLVIELVSSDELESLVTLQESTDSCKNLSHLLRYLDKAAVS